MLPVRFPSRALVTARSSASFSATTISDSLPKASVCKSSRFQESPAGDAQQRVLMRESRPAARFAAGDDLPLPSAASFCTAADKLFNTPSPSSVPTGAAWNFAAICEIKRIRSCRSSRAPSWA